MIHVIGNASIDTLFRLEHLPVPGETLVAEAGTTEDLGGKGANQAIVVARCGGSVRLIAAIGTDAAGQRIRANLTAEGVGTDGLWERPGATDRCIIYIDRAGENMIVSLVDAARTFDPLATTNAAQWIDAGDYVLLQGNLQAGVSRRCLGLAKQQGAITVLNPSPTYPAPDYDWPLVDLAIVNGVEAAELGGTDDLLIGARTLLEGGCGAVILTAGAQGATWIDRETQMHADAPAVPAVDTVGAGDVFCGTLVALLAAGRRSRLALEVATDAAAIAVTRPGVLASFPSRQEIQQTLALAEQRLGAAKESSR